MPTNDRPCSYHTDPSYEAETVQRMGLTYIVLRCTRCDRPQGERLVRKVKP